MKRLKKLQSFKSSTEKRSAIDLLKHTDRLWRMTEKERKEMTISCRDTDYIKKVKEAGNITQVNGVEVQVMHNGLRVENGGYHGEWMAEIIDSLKGHHEPQEEKVFYEVLKKLGSGASMIELGSFWSYYSVWFNTQIKNAKNVGVEPDPQNLALGERNAKLNNANITFIRGAAGAENGNEVEVVMESTNLPETVRICSIDGLMLELKWDKLDLLHMDVQGFEFNALQGAINTINSKKLHFLFVSTHHYLFSGDPNTHGKCLEFIRSHGGHVISSHTVAESFSGDGLIVASFDDRDKDFIVQTSVNHTDKSLFRPYEEDIAILARAYDQI